MYEADYDFTSPAGDFDPDGTEVIKLFYENSPSAGGLTYGTGWIEIFGDDPLGTPEVDTVLQSFIAHELFHNVQFRHGDINARYPRTFVEGTAQLAPSLINPDVNELISTTYSCESIYLDNPGEHLWARPTDNIAGRNVCATSLWWKYLTQQFSTLDASQIDHGIDTLNRLLPHLETNAGWRQQGIDRAIASGDFTGNDVDEILLTSDRYLGIVSPMPFNSTTIDVVNADGRFGSGWRYDPADEIVATCNFVGDRKSEFLIQSDTHLGIVGVDDNGSFQTLDVLAQEGRFGSGWKYSSDDDIMGAGDFDGDGSCEILIKSESHLGLVEHNGGGFQTLFVTQLGERLGDGWVTGEGDRMVAAGDFNGDCLTDIALQSESHVGIIGFDTGSRQLVTLGAMNYPNRPDIGTRYLTGRLGDVGRDRLVVVSREGTDILDYADNSLTMLNSISRRVGVGNLLRDYTLTDMNGDGQDDLVTRETDGTLIVSQYNSRSNTFQALGAAEAGTPLKNEFTDNDQWTPGANYQILSDGDFDGDGKAELFVRDGSRTLVLGLNEGNRVVTSSLLDDNSRFDSITAKLDSFIRTESRSSRTLRSLFTEFTTANYVNSLRGESISDRHRYSDELRYPGAIDFDNNPGTPPVRLADDTIGRGERSNRFSQEPWSAQYYRFTPGDSTLDISLQTERGVENVAYTLLTIEGNRLISGNQLSGASLSESLSVSNGQRVVLIVTSFEASVDYELTSAIR